MPKNIISTSRTVLKKAVEAMDGALPPSTSSLTSSSSSRSSRSKASSLMASTPRGSSSSEGTVT
jgi:hypothetical protein